MLGGRVRPENVHQEEKPMLSPNLQMQWRKVVMFTLTHSRTWDQALQEIKECSRWFGQGNGLKNNKELVLMADELVEELFLSLSKGYG